MSRESRRLLWRFLALLMTVLMIPVFLGGLVFSSQVGSIEADVLETNRRNLELQRDALENTVRNIDAVIAYLRSEPGLTRLLFWSYPVASDRITVIRDAHIDSLITRIDDPYIVDTFVYAAGPRILFTSNDVYLNTALFYPRVYSEDGHTHEQWIGLLGKTEYVPQEIISESITYRGRDTQVLAFRFSLPLYSRREALGSVVALVDRDRIEARMRELLVPTEGFAYIASATGQVLATTGTGSDQTNIDVRLIASDSGVLYTEMSGEEYAVSFVRSSYNGWMYVSGVPVDVFFEQAQRVESIFIVITVVVVLAGIGLAVGIAVTSSRPIIRMNEILKDGVLMRESATRDPLQSMSESVSTLIERNRSLRDLLEEQKPVIRSVVLERLFRGGFDSGRELYTFLDHFDLHLGNGPFGVACALIDGYYDEFNEEILKEFLVKNAVLRQALLPSLPDPCLVHELSLNRVAMVFPLRGDSEIEPEARLRTTLEVVAREVNAMNDFRTLFAAGPIAATLMDVADTLTMAVEWLNHSPSDTTDNGIVFGNRHSSSDAYFYPPEIETRIVNLAVLGRTTEVRGLLHRVRLENLSNRSLSVQGLSGLATEIDGTRVKVSTRVNHVPLRTDSTALPLREHDASTHTDLAMHQHDGGISSEQTLRERIEALLLAIEMESERAANLEEPRHRFRGPLQDYLAEHFADPDMSLKALAVRFKLSEVYLSRLFRELFSKNFHTYVLELRMGRALRLLRETDYTVDRVASDAGYASSHAFRRAFKRHFGVSPSEARTVR